MSNTSRQIAFFMVVVLLAVFNVALLYNAQEANRNKAKVVFKNKNASLSGDTNSNEAEKSVELPSNDTVTTELEKNFSRFFLIETPEITSNLLLTMNTSHLYYNLSLNEDSAEVWLHRGFSECMDYARTLDPEEADIFLIGGYLHLARLGNTGTDYARILEKRLHNKTKPHVLLCPTTNPGTSRNTGISSFGRELIRLGVNMWSVGFERNPFWQPVHPERIISVPYVVRPSLPREQLQRESWASMRTSDFAFYAGDNRKNAVGWAGCNRSMIAPLSNVNNMDVSIRGKRNRLTQAGYNSRMLTSDYCLILCGDTVTSRSLTSAMVYGCIPVQVGSRWRGLCEDPCHEGWGWKVTGKDNPHLPFPHAMNWSIYPELNEAQFAQDPLTTLQAMVRSTNKRPIRANMIKHQMGWIYGWGDPITSQEFGNAAEYVWQSILHSVGLE